MTEEHLVFTETEKALNPLATQLWARHRSMVAELRKVAAAIRNLAKAIQNKQKHTPPVGGASPG